jgi:Bardet-Biedl syndrome 7 protein
MYTAGYDFSELNDASATHMLRLIHPRLEAQLMLAKNCQLIEALQEVQIHEQDTAFLSPQCQFILGKGSILLQTIWPLFLLTFIHSHNYV